NSPGLSWTVDYDGSVEPPLATPPWTLGGSDHAYASGGILDIDTTEALFPYTNYYNRSNIFSGSEWTIEVRLKVFVSEQGDGRLRITFADGTYADSLNFWTGGFTLYGQNAPYYMTTTDDFHVYRITRSGTNVKVYVDGILVLDETITPSPTINALYFGAMIGFVEAPSHSQWDYVKYYTGGAVPPPAGINQFEYLSLIALELDTNLVDFGPTAPGNTVQIAGDSDFLTSEKPTIKNAGNVPIDLDPIIATDLTGGSSIPNDNLYTGFYDSFFDVFLGADMPPYAFYDLNLAPNMFNLENFQLHVPLGTRTGTYSGVVTLTAVESGLIMRHEVYTCCFDNECFSTTIEECRTQGGVITNCIPEHVGEKMSPSANVTLTPTNVTANSNWVGNLTDAVRNSSVATGTYVAGTHDCDDFADELEQNLTARGYHATFTVYWCYDAADNPTRSHCVADVHAPDGSIIFIEPQTGGYANLDFDGDGTVEARNHHETNRVYTDNNCEIEIYEDRASAVAAGVSMD
ncbi:MAG: hypothetical protein HZC29_08850, partial [Thaumarchaeota archaeon]|nr:hypothetical protein [Nitrososphaerota archaeon]